MDAGDVRIRVHHQSADRRALLAREQYPLVFVVGVDGRRAHPVQSHREHAEPRGSIVDDQ